MATPKISIVMGYFNRKEQCLATLHSIQRSSAAAEVEVIIADDGSSTEHVLNETDLAHFKFPIQVWRIAPENKRWMNPAAAYNLAISKAHGEWVILQNPEVQHIGDICGFVNNPKNVDNGCYYAFQVFACASPEISRVVASMTDAQIVANIGKQIKGNWYCHPHYRQKAYHFCTAIHGEKLKALGGFNPIMQDGIDYDDDELLIRVQRICKVQFVRTPGIMGIHLWHPRFAYQRPNLKQLQAKNKALYQAVVRDPKIIKVDTRVAEFGKDFHQIFGS